MFLQNNYTVFKNIRRFRPGHGEKCFNLLIIEQINQETL